VVTLEPGPGFPDDADYYLANGSGQLTLVNFQVVDYMDGVLQGPGLMAPPFALDLTPGHPFRTPAWRFLPGGPNYTSEVVLNGIGLQLKPVGNPPIPGEVAWYVTNHTGHDISVVVSGMTHPLQLAPNTQAQASPMETLNRGTVASEIEILSATYD
jgi:hypothetical protein